MITLEGLIQFIASTLGIGGYHGKIVVSIKDGKIVSLERNRVYSRLDSEVDIVD